MVVDVIVVEGIVGIGFVILTPGESGTDLEVRKDEDDTTFVTLEVVLVTTDVGFDGGPEDVEITSVEVAGLGDVLVLAIGPASRVNRDVGIVLGRSSGAGRASIGITRLVGVTTIVTTATTKTRTMGGSFAFISRRSLRRTTLLTRLVLLLLARVRGLFGLKDGRHFGIFFFAVGFVVAALHNRRIRL